jgi:hypothetical protein
VVAFFAAPDEPSQSPAQRIVILSDERSEESKDLWLSFVSVPANSAQFPERLTKLHLDTAYTEISSPGFQSTTLTPGATKAASSAGVPLSGGNVPQ